MIDFPSLGFEPSRITENSQRIKARFEPDPTPKPQEAAIIAYGSSLIDSWPEMRSCPVTFTCSGAHKFLQERHFKPTYHVDTDPRAHKAVMLGMPRDGVIYLAASIVHPDYLDKLERHDVRLFHLLFQDDEAYDATPSNEWMVTGGTVAGPRTIKLARALGYTKLHLFGFDASGKHAGPHGNAPPDRKYRTVNLHGRQFQTTENLFLQASGFFNEMNTLPPPLELTFHGDGLLQEMAKGWTYQHKPGYPMLVMK